MSIILITDHNENISSITSHLPVKEDSFLPVKTEKLQVKTCKRGTISTSHKTANLKSFQFIPDPCDYLKSKTGKPSYTPGDKHFTKHECARKPKSFPTDEEIKLYETKKEESVKKRPNYVRKNIATVLESKPKMPETKTAIDRMGTTKNIHENMQPIYIYSEGFGKTPIYLTELIQVREKLHQMRKDASGVEKPKCRYIRRDEREELLRGLKHNWAELQHVYQGLPILTDTLPKILRKSKLEAELKQLEKDIVLVERHPYIYVYHGDTL